MTSPAGLAVGIAKALTLVFWWLVVLNLLSPFPKPFSAWVNLAGAFLLLLHIAEMLIFNRRLQSRSHRWLDRTQILLLGIFHLHSVREAAVVPKP